MGNESMEINMVQHRKAWLERLIKELEKLEPLMPIKLMPEGEYPDWVLKVESHIANALFPVARLRVESEITPAKLGALLGHTCASAVWMMEWFQNMPDSYDGLKIALSEEDQLKAQAIKDSILEKWYPGMCRLAKMSLCSCVDQTYDDMLIFLTSFSTAFDKKPKTLQPVGIGNTNFDIYLFMLIFWKRIQYLSSVRMFHQQLVKFYGTHLVGDIKRVEKICERVGLTFRQRGRPKTTQNSDTP